MPIGKPPTRIELADLDPDKVRALVALAAAVALRNGNKGYSKHLWLITDDVAAFNKSRGPRARRQLSPRSKLWGYYARSGHMWLAPHRPLPDKIDTLVHELAHHFTTAGHDDSWRRMYAMLTVLAGQIFDGQAHPDQEDLLVRCAERYVQPWRAQATRWNYNWHTDPEGRIAQARREAVDRMREAMIVHCQRFPLIKAGRRTPTGNVLDLLADLKAREMQDA